MADEKKITEEEERVRKIVDEANEKLMKESDGRPYLLVLTTLHEVDRTGDKSKLAAQWNWRSNIDSRLEGKSEKEAEAAKTLVGFLVEQLRAVAEHPENGIRKKYGLQ